MEFRIIGLGSGVLVGATYFPKEDLEDYSELNVYLGLVCLQWRWI